MRKQLLVTAIACASLATITACGSSSSTKASAPAASGAATSAPAAAAGASSDMVTIKNFMFSPMSLDVKVGTTVTWMNTDSVDHTVTASDKSFNSGNLASGKTFSYTFTKAGTYAYICNIHQYMTATVVVS